MEEPRLFSVILMRCAGLPLTDIPQVATDWVLRADELAAARAAHATLAAQIQDAFDLLLSEIPASPRRTALYNARKAFFQKRRTPKDLAAWDMPDSPAYITLSSLLVQWEQSKAECASLVSAYELGLEQSLAISLDALRPLAQHPTIQRGLLFASHDLLLAFRQNKLLSEKELLSLHRYVWRAAVKTSPLSHFTTLDLLSDEQVEDAPVFDKSLVVPNVALLPLLYDVLLRVPDFYQTLPIRLSSSLQFSEDQWTWLYYDGEQEVFQSLPYKPWIEDFVRVLDMSAKVSYHEVLSALPQEFDDNMRRKALETFVDMGLLEWILPENGLSTSWCGNLYQYLGANCPQTDFISQAAFLLQHLRGTARALPFLDVDAAMEAQKESRQRFCDWIQKHGGPVCDIPVEQFWLEDVQRKARSPIPRRDLEALAQEAASCLLNGTEYTAPAHLRQRLQFFAEKRLVKGEEMDFLTFAHMFLAENPTGTTLRNHNRATTKVGLLAQVFQEDGDWKILLNGAYPGGGKMFSRWLPLFPTQITEMATAWKSSDEVLFPVQHWSNANFQPVFGGVGIRIQDGRNMGQIPVDLKDIAVFLTASGDLGLRHKQNARPIRFADLGLESVDSKPPVMQVLWHLGISFGFLKNFTPLKFPHQLINTYIQYFPRKTEGNVVLSRATWHIGAEAVRQWSATRNYPDFVALLRGEWTAAGMPNRFFVKSGRLHDKPQYFDLENPIALKVLKKLAVKGGDWIVTEVLPDWSTSSDGVVEFVLEAEL
jgi:hypothetical protein